MSSPTEPVSHGSLLLSARTPRFALTEARYCGSITLPRHKHAHPTFLLTVTGGFEQVHRAGAARCAPNDALYEPPGTVHSTVVSRAGALLFFVEVISESGNALRLHRSNREFQVVSEGAFRLLHSLRNELHDPDEFSPLAIDALGLELVIAVARHGFNDRLEPRWYSEVKEALAAEPRRTLPELSRIADRHPSQVARAFRRYCGCSAGEYARKVRATHAKRLLAHTAIPLKEIAHALGYADQSHFTRLFKRYVGLSPAAFRRTAATSSRSQ